MIERVSSNQDDFIGLIKEVSYKGKIKQCLYPNHSECSDRIVKAHSIQNNKIIKQISSNGKVYMSRPKAESIFKEMSLYGRGEATVFTGFCSHHDKTLFQPIEDKVFDKSIEHIFLYVYRCFAIEYHKKQEAINMKEALYKNKRVRIDREVLDEMYHGFQQSLEDFKKEKMTFDNALLTGEYDVLSSVVWEFDGSIKFAFTGFEAMTYDLFGNKIQDATKTDVLLKHVFVVVFSENNKTYCIFSWLKENDDFFIKYKQQLNDLSLEKRKVYINNLAAIITENFVVNPDAWNSLTKEERANFHEAFRSFPAIVDDHEVFVSRLNSNNYDLFEL